MFSCGGGGGSGSEDGDAGEGGLGAQPHRGTEHERDHVPGNEAETG